MPFSKRDQEHLLALGRRIRTARETTGLSQERLAAAANVHRTYMSDLERARRNPTYLVLLRVAAALGTTAGELFQDSPARSRNKKQPPRVLRGAK
jgi:transcriptional regulator with XRE-family HTH domain